MKNERWVTHGCTVTTADDWQDGTNHGGKFVASTYDGAWSDHVPTDEEAAMAKRIAALPELHRQLDYLHKVSFALATSIQNNPVIEKFIRQISPAGWMMFLEQIPWSEAALKKAIGEE